MLMERMDHSRGDSSVMVGRKRGMGVHGGEEDGSIKSGIASTGKSEHAAMATVNSAQSREFLRFWTGFMEERKLDSKVCHERHPIS